MSLARLVVIDLQKHSMAVFVGSKKIHENAFSEIPGSPLFVETYRQDPVAVIQTILNFDASELVE